MLWLWLLKQSYIEWWYWQAVMNLDEVRRNSFSLLSPFFYLLSHFYWGGTPYPLNPQWYQQALSILFVLGSVAPSNANPYMQIHLTQLSESRKWKCATINSIVMQIKAFVYLPLVLHLNSLSPHVSYQCTRLRVFKHVKWMNTQPVTI